MRFLERDDTGEFRLTKHPPNDTNSEIPPYAILSHTWGDEEVLFKDLSDGTAKNKSGYAKIQFCGAQAERDGLRFFWQDTCCIDRSDNAELQHALNSMFDWYRRASKCYIYLADVSTHQQDIDSSDRELPAFRQSRWFTRGWTLQELIAPTMVEFFSKEGLRLGDKKSLEREIHNITGIPLRALRGFPLSDFSFDERKAWAEKRNTTREEDKAYSLFGIFDVHMPVLYGEGKEKAFKRLQDKFHEDYRALAKLWSTEPRDPRVEKKRIELAKGGLLVDAYRWVFENPDFDRWRRSPESRLLWIKGDPGKGKTMLLCGIIDELERPVIADGGNLAYFFCQATDPRINSATAVLRGLIFLLAQRQPRLLSHLPENLYASDDAMAWVTLSKTLFEMLEDRNLKDTYLVIDALDECAIDQQKLLSLIAQISTVSACVKCVISSRNWVQIEEQLATVAQPSKLSLELNAESVTAAIEAFIQHKVLHLSRLKQYGETIEGKVHQYLSSNADGTFLWVALVCQALADPDVQEWHTLEVLQTFPPGLDDLYLRMVHYIKKSKDKLHCKRILAAVSVVQRPINFRELATLVKLPDSITSYRERLEKLIAICGSFLVLREQSIYFVHQSAKDFLLAFGWVFPQGTEDVHHIIFSRSLNKMSPVLKRDMYGLKEPGFPIDEVPTSSSDPLATVRYSCVFWVDHLRDSISDKDALQYNTLDAIQTFLKQKYLYWLEALSLLRAMSEGVIAIRQLELLLGRADQRQLTAFVRDAHRFALSYKWIIEQAPLQAYTSALLFAPASSLVKKKFKAEEPSWINIKPIVEADWNSCLQTLEGHRGSVRSVAFSPDGQRLVSGSTDNTIKIWDPTSGQCLQTLKGHIDSVLSVAFSPDGQRLVSGSYNNTIKIWDPTSGQCLQTLKGHSGSVWSVAFSPDGQRLVSGSYDNTIKIWDPTSGQCLQTLKGHSGSVWSVALSADSLGRYNWGHDQTWINCNGRNVVWLPPEYRPFCSTIQGRMISIGCSSGQVLTIGFSRDV
ncbi:hypothetical protein B0T25DRAFT_606453 [Lasiosphaeria hispida]|uniref:NACHT domain-containing protein n=1 Tax=Lasiosphaeria hispida TaxID=260671 RepID=A0AAJ0MDJ7_9PEZI|nr:hypothetical protein B0T25DRAFT_606453 [Lasiosphaeria hispida]